MRLIAILCVLGPLLTGCSGTVSAKIHAYGLHAITPYGIISLGVLDYERQAKPEDEDRP